MKNLIAISPSQFIFKQIESCDLELLCDWFEKPHVLEWWADRLSRDEVKTKYGCKVENPVVYHYIAYFQNTPIGFIQYYWASQVGDGWWEHEDEGTVGTDQFIGEVEYINRGYGTAMMLAFIQMLLQNPLVTKIITESDPRNYRANGCYQKAGFKEVGEIQTPDGPSHLWVYLR